MKPIKRISAKKYKGLGDVVEVLALPIAKAIDDVFNTDMQHCASCQKRKGFLNRVVPFKDE